MLMLTDAAPQFDLRVQAAWRGCGKPPLLVVDTSTPGLRWRVVSAVLATLLMAASLALAPRLAPSARHARVGHRGGAFAGLRRFVGLQGAALRFFWQHRQALRDATALYAHDQTCGIVATLAHTVYGVPYEYDAHEIVPFRPRRAGALRLRLELAWEQRIVRAARRCHVVNVPMRRIYRRLYGAARYAVRPNDFFTDDALPLQSGGQRFVVYVGATGAHRQLDRMVQLSAQAHGEVLLFGPDGKQAATALGLPAGHGLEGYRQTLAARVSGHAPYFWCAFDPAIVSYRHSLPNKFFQAVALGIPILASEGTYLARLVRRHGFGAVLDASDPNGLWDRTRYEAAADAMRRFRALLRAGRVAV
jgi:hypothetical protein